MAFTQDLGQGPETFFLHANARGDVVTISDENMSWVRKFSYDPWGNITSETSRSSAYEGLSCPFAYAGYFRDQETGLYYMPARYYSPSLRRFLTKDPHPGSKADPLTLNPYQYCRNNPVNNVDPSGQAFFNFNLDFSGLEGMVSQLASAAALMQAGARGMAPFASSMNRIASSIHIGRMPNFAGTFSGFAASATRYYLQGLHIAFPFGGPEAWSILNVQDSPPTAGTHPEHHWYYNWWTIIGPFIKYRSGYQRKEYLADLDDIAYCMYERGGDDRRILETNVAAFRGDNCGGNAFYGATQAHYRGAVELMFVGNQVMLNNICEGSLTVEQMNNVLNALDWGSIIGPALVPQ